MNIINNSIIIFFSLSILISACKQEHPVDDAHGHSHGNTVANDPMAIDDHEEGVIHMTKDQIQTMNIVFGSISQMKINDFVKATGTLGLPPNALTALSPKANGFIKDSKKYIEGSYVKKGDIMAYLENPEFIEQQRTYLEIEAELIYNQQELERQEALVAANAGIEKNVQKLEAQINMKQIKMKGIAKQLEYLGISTVGLTPEKIEQRIPIYAPMSGYLSTINMHNGMFVTPGVELLEIINENHLHLELDVFEKDIAQVIQGQLISYNVPALGDQIYEGEVHIIGKKFNAENKTVRVHGHLENKRPRFIKDLFLEAKIWLNDQTVDALPEKAIVRDGVSSYIYIANSQTNEDEIEFEKVMVVPGITDNGFTVVKLVDNIEPGQQIVTEGAYYVYAQSKVGELEHSH